MKTNVVALMLALLACHCVAFGQESGPSPEPTPASFTSEEEDALVEAIEGGDVAVVRRFLDGGMSPSARFGDGEEVFSLAVRRRQVEVAAVLLERAAKLDEEERPDLEDALKVAVRRAQPKMVGLLLSHGADADAGDGEGHNVLLGAAMSASLADWPPESLAAFFDDDEDEDDSLYRRSPREDRFEILRMLIDGGADLNAVAGDCGMSPLIASAMFGSPEVARLLLEKGADPNVGRKNWNPLHFATASFEELRAEFSDGGSGDTEEISAEEQVKITHLYNATAQGRADVAALLRKAGAWEQWQWPEEKEEEATEGDAAAAPLR